MLSGSCCCGAVRFEITEKPGMMGTCHCRRCRKVGASTLVFVKAETFMLIQGRDSISVYKATPPYKYDRCFCSVCGTALGEVLSDGESFPVAANCIDSEIGLSNAFHEFVADKPAWLIIGDEARQYAHHPVD